MKQNTQYIQTNTIDSRELYSLLKKRKKLIWSITLLFTLLPLIYVSVAKPVYRGSVTIEVGQVADEEFIKEDKYSSSGIRDLDSVENLKNIIHKKFTIDVMIPTKTTLLTYSVEGSKKNIIKNKLEKAIGYTLNRHKEKAKLYSNSHSKVSMTHLISKITVEDTPVRPKKKLIIILAFITGLILSIFLALFLEFITEIKKEV